MKLRFLGTGTSTGVPQIGCKCKVCTSTDVHDKRLRASAILNVDGNNILIDCGPDFRQQIIDAGAPDLLAALLTHSHYDHVGGIDDLRPYCHRAGGFPLYCRHDVAEDLRNRVPYCFKEHPYPGVPSFDIHEIDYSSFRIGETVVTPLPVIHYKLPIVGFRIGRLAYITDAKIIPDETFRLLEGVDTLVINALRREEHLSHMTLDEALIAISRINPRITYLTHLADKMGLQAEVEPTLPENVRIAYDGLEIEIM
ncbi:MAG: MBL fold metallo-hydrolase [Bacteroides sp.]|nr:MBL fold metallo-hydrolase [Bacteroides sp.]MCM1390930.1 MBL fold metallo-hydrolase [Bacteroides sp.]